MKLQRLVAFIVCIGMAALSGCGGGRGLLDSADSLADFNGVSMPLAQSVNEAGMDVKFARRGERNRNRKTREKKTRNRKNRDRSSRDRRNRDRNNRDRRNRDRRNRDGRGGGQVSPPVINTASVNPTTLDIVGGTVAVNARVISSSSSLTVTAEATTSGAPPIAVTLVPTGGGTFAGTLSLPGSPSGVNRTYQVVVKVNDRQNPIVTSTAGTVTLSAAAGEPPPPPVFPD